MADTLTVTDNRTGKTYTLPISDGTIRAADLRQIKVTDTEFGMMSYDPGFLNTASTRSSITDIDGDVGDAIEATRSSNSPSRARFWRRPTCC
jgi:citrate synthase